MNSSADIQNALDPVILYRVNAEKGDGKDLAKEFKIRAYPTFIMVNKAGQIIDLWLGYDKFGFIRTLDDARADLSTIDEKKTRYAAKPDLHSSVVLGRYSSATGEYKDAVAFYQEAQSLTSDLTKNYYYEIFENTANGVRDKNFTYDDAAKAADVVLSSSPKDPWPVILTGNQMIQMAKAAGKPNDVAKYIQAGLDATAATDDPDIKKVHSELMVDFAMTVKGDTASALEYMKASMPQGWQDSAATLNQFAWWCYENHTNLDEAEKLAEKAVALAKPGREKGNIYDTLANIKFTRGKMAEAIDIEKKACKEDTTASGFKDQLKQFEDAAAKGKG